MFVYHSMLITFFNRRMSTSYISSGTLGNLGKSTRLSHPAIHTQQCLEGLGVVHIHRPCLAENDLRIFKHVSFLDLSQICWLTHQHLSRIQHIDIDVYTCTYNIYTVIYIHMYVYTLRMHLPPNSPFPEGFERKLGF